MTGVLYLFTASNSDSFLYRTSVLNCFCKRNFLTQSLSSYTIRQERHFLKQILCYALQIKRDSSLAKVPEQTDKLRHQRAANWEITPHSDQATVLPQLVYPDCYWACTKSSGTTHGQCCTTPRVSVIALLVKITRKLLKNKAASQFSLYWSGLWHT